MLKSLKTITLITGIILGNATVAGAVELMQTPIQTQFELNLAGTDDFDDFSDPGQAQEQDADERKPSAGGGKKSVAKAVLFSALVPGLGEYYVGNKGKAKIFFIAEALTWVGYISYRTYGNWKEDDFIRFASENADAQLEGKNDEFLDMVGFYNDIDQYNSLGRVSDPDRPYLPDTPENHWYWQSNADRDTYRDIKNSSREAFRRADFMLGAAVFNRVISIIDAARDAKRSQRRIDDEFSRADKPFFKIAMDPLNDHRLINVTMYTNLF